MNKQSLQDALGVLDVPSEQKASIVRGTVRASVEALAFMCRLCFSSSLQKRTFDSDDPHPELNQVTHAADQNVTSVGNERLSSTLLHWSKILLLKRK